MLIVRVIFFIGFLRHRESNIYILFNQLREYFFIFICVVDVSFSFSIVKVHSIHVYFCLLNCMRLRLLEMCGDDDAAAGRRSAAIFQMFSSAAQLATVCVRES